MSTTLQAPQEIASPATKGAAVRRAEIPGGFRPRVLMIVESAAGGTGRHVLDLSEGLIRRGCEVHVVYSTGRIDKLFSERMATVKGLKSTGMRMRTTIHPSDFGVALAIKRYMREHGPFDVVHGHSSKGGALARLAALGTRSRAVYTLHGLIMMDPGLARWKRTFYLGVELMLGLRTSRTIAVSPEEQRAAVRLGFGKDKVVLAPNGLNEFACAPRDEARRTIGVSDEHLVIGFVGRLVDQKAPHVLIEAFARATKVAPHARLVLVGGGPLQDESQRLALRLGVKDKVIFLGERDSRTVFAGFDVFAMSSRKEGLPYVVLEAMWCGLPVVATAASGVEILVESGVTGEVVPTDDVETFAVALSALAANSEKLAACGKASKRRSELFTVDAMVDNTLAAYATGESQPADVPLADDEDGPVLAHE